MDVVAAARSLIADTLAFHLLFITFGVALPLIISATELYGIVKKRPRAVRLAHTWSKALVILFIAGAVSGTIVGLQFSLLWPTFMALAGQVVGVAFALEGFAFLVEALFLSVYMLSWNRFKPWQHWLCSLPIVLGSLTSAYFITTVNAWMNTPQGFSLNAQGEPININTHQAVFNPAVGTETSHSILAYMLAASLVLAAVYAWIVLRHKLEPKLKARVLKLVAALAAVALVFALLVGFTGDRSGKFLAKNEPLKLAAAEGLQTTSSDVPLLVGGVVDGDHIKYAIAVPNLLSWLATGDIHGQVKGLDSAPSKDRPPLIVHYFFDGMVAIGSLAIVVTLAYVAASRWRPSWAASKPLLIALVVCGVLGLVGVELGWMLTEFGRQPYVIKGIMRTTEAATSSKAAIHFAYIFPLFYLVLFVLTIIGLKKTVKSTEALK